MKITILVTSTYLNLRFQKIIKGSTMWICYEDQVCLVPSARSRYLDAVQVKFCMIGIYMYSMF